VSNNSFLDATRAGAHPLVTSVSSASTTMVELIARSGFDAVWLDLQHGPLRSADLHALIAVLWLCNTVAVVRIPSNDRAVIGAVLDAGCYVVICPDVQTAEEARVFAEACRYPPAGTRSFGPSRAQLNPVQPFSTDAENRSVMAVVQIESPVGLSNLDAIVSTEGVDGVFPGMVDYELYVSGRVIPGLSFLDASVRAPLMRIIDATHAAGKSVGLPVADLANMPELLDLGADWLLVGGERGWIANGARTTLASARDSIASWSADRTQADAKTSGGHAG
jgi:4-hydroxy-2-oxoheptanedioate aldolase